MTPAGGPRGRRHAGEHPRGVDEFNEQDRNSAAPVTDPWHALRAKRTAEDAATEVYQFCDLAGPGCADPGAPSPPPQTAVDAATPCSTVRPATAWLAHLAFAEELGSRRPSGRAGSHASRRVTVPAPPGGTLSWPTSRASNWKEAATLRGGWAGPAASAGPGAGSWACLWVVDPEDAVRLRRTSGPRTGRGAGSVDAGRQARSRWTPPAALELCTHRGRPPAARCLPKKRHDLWLESCLRRCTASRRGAAAVTTPRSCSAG